MKIEKQEKVKKSKIYTGIGDRGSTKLLHNADVGKDHYIVELLGTIDELNSALGVSRAMGYGWSVYTIIPEIQEDLFELGAQIADIEGYYGRAFYEIPVNHPDPDPPSPRILKHDVDRIERLCDEWDAKLEPLTAFILPGGGMVSSSLHHARSICRRAERRLVDLFHKNSPIDNPYEDAVVYLNRLSDFLFILARCMAKETGMPETKWLGRETPSVKE